jgi:CheY-like chemotaxis protein
MRRQPATVLIADDDPDSRTILREILLFQGRSVLEAVLRAPDLIVLDLLMPGMDGWQAAAVLKADPGTRDIPILALTADVIPAHRERALLVGCDSVASKPIEPRQLAREIDALYIRTRARIHAGAA